MFNKNAKLDKNFIQQNRRFFVSPKFPAFLEKAVRISKIVLLVLIAKSLVSCGDKEDPQTELKKEIAKLEKDSIQATNNCRAARIIAINGPGGDISPVWNFDANGGQNAKSIKDTMDVDEIVIDGLYEVYGDPLPKNDVEVKNYKGSIITWNQVVKMLTNDRNKLKK